MIRNITVDGEAALAVDTAEELGRALVTGRYVVASDAVRAEYGLTDTANSDTQDIVDESDWRDDAWRCTSSNQSGPMSSFRKSDFLPVIRPRRCV